MGARRSSLTSLPRTPLPGTTNRDDFCCTWEVRTSSIASAFPPEFLAGFELGVPTNHQVLVRLDAYRHMYALFSSFVIPRAVNIRHKNAFYFHGFRTQLRLGW